jgi:Na+-driven multidrug efflux pump
MWAFRIGLGYVLAIVLKMGILGIWVAMYIDWLVRGIMYSFRLRGNKWIMHRV